MLLKKYLDYNNYLTIKQLHFPMHYVIIIKKLNKIHIIKVIHNNHK